jgi:hypothetical protein
METTNEQLREHATKRIREKTGFRIHVVIYVLFNTMLTGLWWFTGEGFFWPIFPILIWGFGVVINGYTVYSDDTPTEDQIRREMESLAR